MCHKAIIFIYIFKWTLWKCVRETFSPTSFLCMFAGGYFFSLSWESSIQHIKKFNTMRLLFIIPFPKKNSTISSFFLLKIYKRCQTLWRKERFSFVHFSTDFTYAIPWTWLVFYSIFSKIETKPPVSSLISHRAVITTHKGKKKKKQQNPLLVVSIEQTKNLSSSPTGLTFSASLLQSELHFSSQSVSDLLTWCPCQILGIGSEGEEAIP